MFVIFVTEEVKISTYIFLGTQKTTFFLNYLNVNKPRSFPSETGSFSFENVYLKSVSRHL